MLHETCYMIDCYMLDGSDCMSLTGCQLLQARSIHIRVNPEPATLSCWQLHGTSDCPGRTCQKADFEFNPTIHAKSASQIQQTECCYRPSRGNTWWIPSQDPTAHYIETYIVKYTRALPCWSKWNDCKRSQTLSFVLSDHQASINLWHKTLMI